MPDKTTNHKEIDPAQLETAQNFMMFLGQQIEQVSENLEEGFSCSPDEMQVFQMLEQHGPMMVKDIAANLGDISSGSLTRLLDRLEQNDFIKRKANPKDRRSVQIVLTAKSNSIMEYRSQVMGAIAQRMLSTLTPTERLILVELYSKIVANWSNSVETDPV